jgi:hypothetical protein
MAKEIHVKCWPIHFNLWISRRKSFEIRWNDRNYQTGDTLIQHEWDPETKAYTGRVGVGTIGYVLRDRKGLVSGWVGIECPFLKMVIKPKQEGDSYGY